MLLYFIRHGDPVYNPDSLTDLGKRQAEAVGRRLALYGIDRLIEDKLEQKETTRSSMYSQIIQEREELSEQIRALEMLKKLAGRLNEAQFRLSAMQMRNSLGRVMLQLRHEIDNSEAPKDKTD